MPRLASPCPLPLWLTPDLMGEGLDSNQQKPGATQCVYLSATFAIEWQAGQDSHLNPRSRPGMLITTPTY
jgi:hypothetical protein